MAKKTSSNRYLKLQKNNEITAAATKHISFGAVVFLMIFAYLLIVMINFAVKENVNYTVAEKGVLSYSNTYRGLIIRNESPVTAKDSGTIKYFMTEGSRVRKDSPIFGIISDTEMVALLDAELEKANQNLSADDPVFDESYGYLKNRIKNYVMNQHDKSFAFTYDAKQQILNDITEIRNTVILQQQDGDSNSIALLESQLKDHIVYSRSEESGLVSYKVDGMEFINIENFVPSHLDMTVINQATSLKTTANEGQAVAKVVDNLLWHIAAEIDDECEKQLEDEVGSYIGVEFTEKNLSLDVKLIDIFDEGQKTYMILEVDRKIN